MRSPVLLLVFSLSASLAACTRSGDPAPVSSEGATKAYIRPSSDELRARLTPLAFEVTQSAATEPPFANAYWNNHAAGIYVDVVSGDALFSSRDKFESGTGWPSFTQPIADGAIIEHEDATLGMTRTEVVSKAAGSHLGHVFDDGPPPTHRRYCMNSAALRFIPAERLVAEGYGRYAAKLGVAPTEALPETHNSCALPPPGHKPGCHATLAVAIFAALPDDARVAKPDGILAVAEGRAGSERAVEITYNPEQISYARLVQAWTNGRESRSKVLDQDARFERN